MKILFSNPPWWEGRHEISIRQGVRAGSRWPFTYIGKSTPDNFVSGDYIPYPFFMGYAAAYTREKTGLNVKMRDSIALKESYQAYYQYIQGEQFDFIFIESASPSWEHDKNIILHIKRLSPDTHIVVTGPISSLGKKIINEFSVYAVIKGEYEKGSIAVLNGESGIIDYDLLTEEEMSDAPFPYLDDIIAYRYWDSNPQGQIFPHAQIWSSRGCPFKCIFCVWPAVMTGNDPEGNRQRRVRRYSPEYMERYITYLVKKYNYKSIYFDDDTFNLGDRHTIAVSSVMKKIGLPWSAMCRPDTIRIETWRIMKDSGCVGVKLGFESGSQYVVDKIVNKTLDLEYAVGVVKHIQQLGMSVHGTFTLGLPGETREQMQDTIEFVKRVNCNTVQYSGCAEIEGTPLSFISKNRTGLKGYEGAVMDEYDHKTDGGKKRRELFI